MEDEIVKEILNGIKEAVNDLRDDQREIKRDLKEIKDVQVQQQITQAEQHITLVDHTKRSTANEEEIRLTKALFEKQLEPIKKDIWQAKGAIGFIGLAFIVLSILALFHKI